jgi:hypothetical protein
MGIRVAVATLSGAMVLACAVLSGQISGETTQGPACSPLPEGFRQDDLVGRWVAEYHGGLDVDRLIIREDGLYRQVFSGSVLSFESDWLQWWLEYDPDGYGLLHLSGMRRCDGIESTCDDPGGGLPPGILAVNQCRQEYMFYSDEVILLVTGAADLPRGIELQHARMAGAGYYYTFRLDE